MKSNLTFIISILLSAGALVGLMVIFNGASAHSERDGNGQSTTQLHSGVMSKSIGFYVGRDLTDDGSTLLGGFGHEPSSHWIDIVPAQEHSEGAMVKVGVTEEASIRGELIEIPQKQQTYKYISSSYSEFAGFPPPLTNGGLNEHGVAARDIWSPSRIELIEMTEVPQRGPNYSDLSRMVMERAKTAREAVEIVGNAINKYGYSTYGGNSHLFADEKEGWVFINYAGGQGLWAAERLGPDKVRVSYPGYIHEFPADFEAREGYLASPNLVSFAIEQGWWDPETGNPDYLNLQDVYGLPFPGENVSSEENYYISARVPPDREAELRELAPVKLTDMLALVRDPRWSDDRAGYGHVAHIRPDADNELLTLWLAVTGAVTTPFVPIPIAAETVPAEFRQHRYMTKGADSGFLSSEYAHQEAVRYATREFKRLLYFTCTHPEDYLPRILGEIERLEQNFLTSWKQLENRATALIEEGSRQEARALVSEQTQEFLLQSLNLGMRLAGEIEQATRQDHGLSMPEGKPEEGETTPPSSQSMNARSGDDYIHCYIPGLTDFPRSHGSFIE